MKPNETKKKKNIFRDTPLRFLGYANEVGESFRPLIPLKLVISTYVVSGFYVFADSLFIGLNSYNNMFNLDLQSSEYLVVGQRANDNPTDLKDIKYNFMEIKYKRI
jgi:hypothetical protein